MKVLPGLAPPHQTPVIHELSVQLVSAWHDTSWIEFIAAVLAVAYLLLAIRQRLSCWLAAFVSSGLYVWVLFTRAPVHGVGAQCVLRGDGGLWFLAVAARQGRRRAGGDRAGRSRATPRRCSASSRCRSSTAFFLRRYTPAAWPFLDSMVAWSSVFATFLVARKVYENWHWWLADRLGQPVPVFHAPLVSDGAAVWLYLILIVIGMREWRRSLPAAAYAVA